MNNQTSKYKVILLIVMLFAITPCFAQNNVGTSLEQATKKIQLESKGKVLSAKTKYDNGKSAHHIRVLTPSGRVKNYRVPVYNLNNNNSNTIQDKNPNYNKPPRNYRDGSPNYRQDPKSKHNDRQNNSTKIQTRKDTRSKRSYNQNNGIKTNTRKYNSSSKGDRKQK